MADVVISDEAVKAYVAAPDGPVGQYMMQVGEQIKQTAIGMLSASGSGGWTVKGFLGPTIVKRAVNSPEGVGVRVGSDHTKTPPHMIRGNPILTFHWPKVGRVVHFRKVNHPGSEYHDYLLKILVAALDVVRGNL